MSGAELALGIVGAVATLAIAIKACKRVAEKYSSFENAELEICERSTRLLSNCLQMGRQVAIFEQIKDQFHGQGHDVQTRSFKMLAVKLNIATAELEAFMTDGLIKSESRNYAQKRLSKRERASYVMRKSNLDKAIDEVETWQRLTFDPLWFETMKLQNQQVDNLLQQNRKDKIITATLSVRNPLKNLSTTSIFLPARKLASAETTTVAYSSIKLVNVDDKWRLLDTIHSAEKETVHELAVRLRNANPSSFGLLTCLGAVHHHPSTQFSLVFRIPDGMSSPETLRVKLTSTTIPPHSLSERFRLATQLARAVFHFHTFNMVHKNIRPENILLFQDKESTLGSAFLLGFERIRRDADGTRLSGDEDWAKNLYRHPQRQGSHVEDRYVMQHDIYSLGVLLLELGLWSSFLTYTPHKTPSPSPLFLPASSCIAGSETTKSHLLTLAQSLLPTKMGDKYTEVVEACLTCLDVGNEEFCDDEEETEEDIEGQGREGQGREGVGVRYVEKLSIPR